MPDDDLTYYLAAFTEKAKAMGLEMRNPGKNWAPMRDVIPGSHISLSVRKDCIQVNLNNERDDDRAQLDRLYQDRTAICEAIGEDLSWEKKDGRKKTAVRATLPNGYEDRADWDRQHKWAIDTMKAFDRELGSRLRSQV